MEVEETDTSGAAGAVDEPTGDPEAQSAVPDQETPSAAAETPVSPNTGEEPAPDEGEEPASDEDNLADLDDETLEALAEVYGDKFLGSKPLQERINKAIQQQVAKQTAERQRTYESQDEVGRIIDRGKQAVDGLTQLAQAAATELGKASRGEEFVAEAFEPGKFAGHLDSYGQAIVAEVSLRYDQALQDAIETSLADRLPELSENQTQEFLGIVYNVQRMENDPKQAPQAKSYFVTSMLNFLLDRSHEAGAVEERDRLSKKGTVAKKIADSNAVKAAQAKLAASKGNPPPKSPTSTPAKRTATGGNYDSEVYRELKKAGKFDEADAYVSQFAGVKLAPA